MSKGLQQCSAMQQVVRLLGDLGERYGAEHTYFDLRTPADAIKLLCLNSPALQQELIEAHEHGVGYRLIQAGADLDLEDLQLPIGSNDLILAPVIAGSGDDEHGWTDKGLVNFEGGCYAKTIRLSRDDEPQIWDACHMRGTILENVVLKDGVADFEDSKHTENTRASYPTYYIDNADGDGFINEQPKNIVMLTCDAFGVLPPVCKLDPDEAVQQFLLGYTAKVAGTEQGVKEPIATFSPCFGLPFMPRPPRRYGEILRDKVIKNNVNCWLVNTGWIGGGYGDGKRIPIRITRKIIDLINSGEMAKFDTFKHEFTGFTIPDVQGDAELSSVLRPESSWQGKAVQYMHYVEILMDSFSAHYRTHKS
jgi:phosphoenolpyruvate carboxykinase (ATP)